MKLQSGKNKNPFICAFNGLKKAWKSEKHLKVDTIFAIVVTIFGVLLKISITEWIVCILLIGIMISAELMNTAIETVVDMYTREQNELAGKAKDVAAGAVLICAIMSAIIGLIIFVPKIIEIIK